MASTPRDIPVPQPDVSPSTGGLPVVEPQCRHLRSKGMYITGALNPAAENVGVGDGNCWCSKTLQVLGPDDNMVNRQKCVPGRTCFVAWG